MSKKLNFVNISLGCDELNSLRKVGLRDFINGIIFYDGDVDVASQTYKAKNSIVLPGDCSPEQILFKFLKSLPQNDEFWGSLPEEHSKQICFAGYEDFDGSEVKCAKDWFFNQKDNFGSGSSKLFTGWKKNNTEELKRSQDNLMVVFNAVGGFL